MMNFEEGDRVEFMLGSKHSGTDTSYVIGERGTVIGAYPAGPVNDDELLVAVDGFAPRWVNIDPVIVRKLSILEVIAEAAR
jgi:hypothetical protein